MSIELSALSPDNIVDFLGSIIERRGSEEYLGESVTISEHMLQGATIAERNGQAEEIIVAALLHDIGHLTSDLGSFTMEDSEDRHHEDAGAAILERFFPAVITDCVRHHVAAKRYLCAARPSYFRKLSKASVHSLNLQGGAMNAREAAEFEARPNFRQIIAVRYLDDVGKRPGMQTPGFVHFAPLVQKLVDGHSERQA